VDIDLEFLLGYIGALLGLVTIGGLVRYGCRTGGRGSVKTLSAPEVAILLDGRSRALHASLAALRVARVVDIGPEGRPLVSGPLPDGMTDLDRAVYAAAERGVNARSLWSDPGVCAALDDAAAVVRRSGWTMGARRRRYARAGTWLLLPLMFTGLAVILGGLVRGEGLNDWLPALVFFTGLGALGFHEVPTKSRGAEKLIARALNHYSHLKPSYSPSWRTYGPHAAAMAVALHGDAALWRGDPLLAEGLSRPRPTSARRSAGRAAGGSCSTDGCGVDGCGGCGGD
jgi:uncharacterized protein (TIGR04222 family)